MLEARDQYLNSQSNQLILAIPEAAFGGGFVMPELHGFQINEIVAVSSPEVVITGALTGIGRAAARLFAQEGVHGVVSPRVRRGSDVLISADRQAVLDRINSI